MIGTTNIEYQHCWRKVKRRFFRKKVKTVCEKLTRAIAESSGERKAPNKVCFESFLEIIEQALLPLRCPSTGSSMHEMPITVDIFGGNTAHKAALSVINLENPEANGEIYSNWASSVKDFPQIIEKKVGKCLFFKYMFVGLVCLYQIFCYQAAAANFSFFAQLRPLHELVKEVNCAGVKKLHLKRAIEEYLSQEDSCRCRPCQNNGQPLLVASVCYCSCRDGTSGAACQIGTVAREPAGEANCSFPLFNGQPMVYIRGILVPSLILHF